MRYLVSVAPESVCKDDADKWAPEGEPVVPWFPAPVENVFLSIESFKKAPYAMVVDQADIDPDILSGLLKKQYPGLPEKLIENYVMATARVAQKYPIDTKLQITISKTSAKIFPCGKAEVAYTMWDQQPLQGDL